MAVNQKRTNQKRAYNEKAYERLAITIPKGRKEEVENHAASRGLSVNGLVNNLLRVDMGIATDREWKECCKDAKAEANTEQ